MYHAVGFRTMNLRASLHLEDQLPRATPDAMMVVDYPNGRRLGRSVKSASNSVHGKDVNLFGTRFRQGRSSAMKPSIFVTFGLAVAIVVGGCASAPAPA